MSKLKEKSLNFAFIFLIPFLLFFFFKDITSWSQFTSYSSICSINIYRHCADNCANTATRPEVISIVSMNINIYVSCIVYVEKWDFHKISCFPIMKESHCQAVQLISPGCIAMHFIQSNTVLGFHWCV